MCTINQFYFAVTCLTLPLPVMKYRGSNSEAVVAGVFSGVPAVKEGVVLQNMPRPLSSTAFPILQ